MRMGMKGRVPSLGTGNVITPSPAGPRSRFGIIKAKSEQRKRSPDSLQACSAQHPDLYNIGIHPEHRGTSSGRALGGGQGPHIQTVAFQPSNEQRGQWA